MDRRLPSCCGSEDGDIVYGVDLASDGTDTMMEAWACHTCGVLTIVAVVMMERKTTPR